jgi:hypothetical protein
MKTILNKPKVTRKKSINQQILELSKEINKSATIKYFKKLINDSNN